MATIDDVRGNFRFTINLDDERTFQTTRELTLSRDIGGTWIVAAMPVE